MVKYSTKQIKELIIQEALKQNIDPALVLAIAEYESGFDPNAKNFTNAEKSYGLFQINTKAHPAYKGGFDPKQNIRYGVGIFKDALRKAGGDPYKAFAIYNGGVGGQQASIRNGYPKAVGKLVDKHRNSTVPNSAYVTNKAKGVKMNNTNDNTKLLEGSVLNKNISPISAQGLKNTLDSIGSGARKIEQRFRSTIPPATKNMLVREMLATGFRPDIVALYSNAGGDLAELKKDLQQAGVIGDKAPWEAGGQSVALMGEGIRRRQEMQRLALQQASDELDLINQLRDPTVRAEREQSMRDRLNNTFSRYNQMVDNLQDPRLQNTGYQLSPQELEAGLRGQGMMALLGMTNNAPTAQQIAQARYENQVANQYGVPYQQVLEAQKNQFDMKQKLLAGQIEQDFALETQLARTDADIAAAQRRRIDNYYKLQQDAIKAENDYNDMMMKGYLGIQQSSVAPTIQGSQGILTKGMDIQGNLLDTDLAGRYNLQKQNIASQADIDKANINAKTELTKSQMQLEDPYERTKKMGQAVSGFAAGAGYNPILTGRLIESTPAGGLIFPSGAPTYNSNANNLVNNQDGGLRLNFNVNPYQQ